MVPPIVVIPPAVFWKVCDAPSVSGMLHEFEPALSVMPLVIVKALPLRAYPLVLKVIESICSPVKSLFGAGRGLAAKIKSSPLVVTGVFQFKAVFQLLSAPPPVRAYPLVLKVIESICSPVKSLFGAGRGLAGSEQRFY